jgi:hypothetical protein
MIFLAAHVMIIWIGNLTGSILERIVPGFCGIIPGDRKN